MKDLTRNIILETDRLILRALTPDDTDFILTLLNSPGWLQFIGDRNVRTTQEAREYLLNGPIKGHKQIGLGLSMVLLKKTQKPVGMCGLLKRDYLDHHDIGFAFLPGHEGNGYGFEIAREVIRYASNVLGLKPVMAITVPANTRSIRLLEKLGMRFLKNIPVPPANEELMLFSTHPDHHQSNDSTSIDSI